MLSHPTDRQHRRLAAIELLEPRRLLSTDVGPLLAADAAADSLPPRQVEALNRGLVVVRRGTTAAYLSWRLLATDPASAGFNVYRSANGATPVKLNGSPLTATTDYSDNTLNAAVPNRYYVRPVVGGVEQAASESFTLAANTPIRQYLSIPLQIPAAVTSPDGVTHNYTANDASVGDLDGDGAYEIVLKWEPAASATTTHNVGDYLDAYEMDGTLLWRIYTGKNIKSGAGHFQFIVYDLDGDGRAEVAVNTGEGLVSGTGQVIGDPDRDWRTASTGYVNAGPEYLTLLDGRTGAILASTDFQPARGAVTDWGDDYGHRANGIKATVAYLDGQRPSLVFGRGIYHGRDGYPGKTQIVAYNWRGGQLTRGWTFTATTNGPNPTYVGQGNHQVDVGDLDGDGRDEILWGGMAVDDDGSPLYTTRLGHGDALHLSDMDPSRPGLEAFKANESPGEYTRDDNGDGVAEDNGGALFDAATGQVLVGIPGNGADVGRGLAMDIDPRPGYEMWTSASDSIYNVDGTVVAAKPSNMFINFGVWWDADLYRELLDRTTISNWTAATGRSNFDLDPAASGAQGYAPGATDNNGTKATPALSGDILGDWREEVIWRTGDNTELRIFTTIIPAANRLVTLMHDVQYREAIAWQNVGYNQPPHPSFFLGNGMSAPPAPNVYLAGTGAAKPNVTSPAAAAPALTHHRSTTLSVFADDADTGEPSLTYTWSLAGTPPAPVTFSANGTNAARTTTAVFTAEGTYDFLVTVSDPTGRTATSTVTVVVNDDVVTYLNDVADGTTLPDSSGNNYPATLSGSYTFVPGVRGNALRLNGGAATLPAGIVSTLNDFTVATWVRPDSLSNWARVFDFGSGTTSHMFLTARAGTTGRPRFAITTGGGTAEQQLDAPAALTAGVWTHLAVTLAGNAATLYVNGVAVATNAAMTLRPSSLGSTTQNYIGDSQYSADPALLGSIDDFRLLGRALSAAEVRAIVGGTVTGQTFYDTNADEVFNPGEPALAGVTVFLDANTNGVRDADEASAVTSATGAYSFPGVPAGSYTVRQTGMPAGFVEATHPAVAVTNGVTSTANPAGTRIAYTGTASDDVYLLRRNTAGKYELLVGGTLAYTLPAGTPSLSFALGAGADTLSLDFSSGSPIPAGGVSYDAGTGADALQVSGGAATGTVTVNGGSVAASGDMSGVTLAFAGDGGVGVGDAPLTVANPPEAIRGYLAAGRIFSSTGVTGSGVGYLRSVPDGPVALRSVRIGDTNIDGTVDADDLVRMDRGRLMGLGFWVNGDLNYDGVVNDADYGLMYPSYLSSPDFVGPVSVVAALSAGPAPAAASLVAPAGLAAEFAGTPKGGYRAGRTATARVRVTNAETTTVAGMVTLRLVFSEDPVLDEGDVALGSAAGMRVRLKSGAAKLFNVSGRIPAGAAGYLLAIVDGDVGEAVASVRVRAG